ncbi:MAG: hypothetical protein IJ668_12170 [Selenomonadaceae bacterium]|nr:hypothetical protein [Selenomonadaceae bacterium]
MVVVINYANELYRQSQIMCTAAAYHFGADKVWEYSPQNIPPEFYQAHKAILDQPRGNGYWLWKPLIILDALSKVDEGDYVFYIDSGATLCDDIHLLVNAMNADNANIMTFVCPGATEKTWTKRDAFILMDCDAPEYTDTDQLASGFEIFKKSAESIAFVEEWLRYMTDARIVTDIPNQLGQPNYPEFMENRHDQSVLSLLAKKKKLPLFRTPSSPHSTAGYPEDVLARSPYPLIIDTNRRRNWTMTLDEYLKLNSKRTTAPRGLECVCVLMVEKFYSEALKMLLHLMSRSPLVARGGGLGRTEGSAPSDE